MRVAVYTDYAYREQAGEVYSERAFSLFVAAVAEKLESTVVIGRLDPGGSGDASYPLGDGVGFVALPFYPTLARPTQALGAALGSLRAFSRALDDVDCVWLLGPHPLAIAFAVVATARRRRVVLGVRQDLPRYVRARRPGKRGLLIAAHMLEALWRLLARRLPVVVVGPELADNYHRSPQRLEIAVSLVREDEIVSPGTASAEYDQGSLRILTVGRLEAEKNPLLLADILAELRSDGRDWRLQVAGVGDLRDQLSARLAELGVADYAVLAGYVPADGGLRELYRTSDLFLHVSWTEGLPQVLLEAFAAALPTVATDVGGVRAAVGEAAILVPAGDAAAASDALRAIVADPDRRGRLLDRAFSYVSARTLEAESTRVAQFLRCGAPM